ncbi:MAG: hypothetical protein IJM88_02500 [Bacteroidales bacterium]|nr:hypothetical protein [Bacteroidales bacterium]
MKRSFLTGFLGIAFAFAMVGCGSNAATEEVAEDTTCANVEQTEEHCMKHCQMTCPDSVCLANNCENCACPEDSPCHQKPACKGEQGQCCKDKAAAEGQCCKKQDGEGCKKECEKKQ